jgi:hypothetical protein
MLGSNRKTILSVVILAAIYAPVSQAYFDVIDEPAKPVGAAATPGLDYANRVNGSIVRGSLSQFGSGTATMIEGSGNEITVSDSLLMVVPKGWRADVPFAVRNRKASWFSDGSRTWVDMVDMIAKSSNSAFIIDWDKKLVSGRDASGDTATTTPLGAIDKSKGRPSYLYRIAKGDTLFGALSVWAAKGGWTLDWGIDGDYLLKANTIFTTDIKLSVEELISGLNASSGSFVSAAFYAKNKVIRIYQEK